MDMNALCVFAAACLTGQMMDPPVAQTAQPVQTPVANTSANAPPPPQHYLFPRLHGFLHPQSKQCAACAAKAQGTPPASTQQPPLAQTVSIQVPTAIQKRYAEKVGHENDYSWITGQLYYIEADGGRWIVRYATADTEDRYHGNILLPPDFNMRNFRSGDLVSVQGEILNNGIPSRIGEAPFYKVNSIDVIERVD
jgi:hypothetical protein